MSQDVLIGFANILIILGGLFILRSFFAESEKCNQRKIIYIGGIGVTLTIIGGLILVFFYYSLKPVSERIIRERLEDGYSDKLLDVSLLSDHSNNPLKKLLDQEEI